MFMSYHMIAFASPIKMNECPKWRLKISHVGTHHGCRKANLARPTSVNQLRYTLVTPIERCDLQNMPGIPNQALTPSEFKAWKEHQEAVKLQVNSHTLLEFLN